MAKLTGSFEPVLLLDTTHSTIFSVRKLIGFLVSLTVILSCTQAPKITKTQEAIRHAQSAIVRLEIPGRVCTAFYVGNNVFLTAAHCLDSQNLIFLRKPDNTLYMATPIIVDTDKDLATLQSKTDFIGDPLEIWTGKGPDLGAELLAIGFPGYYDTNLIFEVGYLKDLMIYNKTKMIVSSELGYPGESGGPVIDTASGLVVGITDMIMEAVESLHNSKTGKPMRVDDDIVLHYHKSISLAIGFPEILEMMDRTQDALDAAKENQ